MNRRDFLSVVAGAVSALPRRAQAQAAPVVEASLTIDDAHRGPMIARDVMGLSYESAVLASPDYFSPTNRSVVGLIRGLGTGGVLRLGGNTSERTFWQVARDVPNGERDGERYVITPAAIDALAACLDQVDWRLIYGLNLARGTPDAAGEEAAYVAGAVGPRLLAFQIGNEPDGFSRWSGERATPYDVSDYISEWRQFQAAIRARLPNAPFAGPAIAGDAHWIRPFVAATRDSLVLVTRHYYADGPAHAPYISLKRLLDSAPKIEPILAEARAIGRQFGLPFRIGEMNSIFMEGQPGVSDAFASALWGAELMFQVAAAGGAGVNVHTGDAKAYTPIGPGLNGWHAPRPLYYGMRLFREAAIDAALLPARLTAPGLNMAAYAMRAADGSLRVCLINKDVAGGARVAINAGRGFESASVIRLTAPSVAATTDVTLGGSPIDDFGDWSPKQPEPLQRGDGVIVTVPAGSAALAYLRRPYL